MVSLSVTKRLPGFTLEASWEADEPVVALFGPSGSGKSLTLHCLSGLVRPDRGRIVLNGRVFFDSHARLNLPPQARHLGYVFQGYALFPHLTIEENVAFGLRGRPRKERVERTGMVLERLGLGGLERRYPRELSGGQQQRVALGRALAVDPELLLLDEPLSALDAPLRLQLRQELGRIIREWGKATVLVTHDLAEAYQLADRIVVYAEGRVLQAAAKSELLWQPPSEQVARLIGVRNLLRGTVVKATPEIIHLRWRGQTLEAVNSPSRLYLPPPGTSLAFFIRPEYVRLIRKDRPGPDPHHMNVMNGEIVGEVDQGTLWALFFRLEVPGEPSQGFYDLEIEVPKLVHEILELSRDRHWQISLHRGSLQVLPSE
ncbi:MAG: ABC transporter ATP-binding protein [Candidatus Methylomirabilia bacterium]